MKPHFVIATVFLFTYVNGNQGDLLGRRDGHEPQGKTQLGQNDGHEFSNTKLIGANDGHDFGHHADEPKSTKTPLIGEDDGHEPTRKHLIGEDDGHEPTRKHLIGEDDGHEPTRKHLIGEDDGHERKTPTDRPDDWNIEIIISSHDVDANHDNEGPLVRCKRPICEQVLSCHFGPQVDANGCATCNCLEDPCLEEKCETGYACSPLGCPVGPPCRKLESKCIRKRCNGPQPMCATYCPLGYRLKDDGCMTCVCRDRPNLHNFTAEGVSEDYDSSSEAEEDDYEADEDDPLVIEEIDSDFEEDLIEYDHHEDLHHNNNEEEDDDKPNVDEGEMCETTQCRGNEVCKSDWKYPGDSENEKTNMICMVKTRCWAMTNEPELYEGRKSDRDPTCDPSLLFEPLQCFQMEESSLKSKQETCWCVTDLGEMIDGTRTRVYAEEQKPICERNNTISATVVMKFNVTASGSRSNTIVEALTKDVSKITHVPHGAIKILSVDYPLIPAKGKVENVVTVTFVLSNDPDYDLPYALDLLFKVSGLTLNFDLYKVKQFGKPMVTHYQFTFPAPPVVGTEDDSDLLDRFDGPLPDFVYNGQTADHLVRASFFNKSFIVACLTVLSALILVVLSIIIVLARRNCSRSHIRHHQLQNQMSVAVDQEQFAGDPRKNESVVLITDDVLSKVDSSVA